MTKVIVKGSETKDEVCDGQIRADGCGRIVMIITDERLDSDYDRTETKRALVLRESNRGFAKPFTTIPQTFASDNAIVRAYPKVLTGTITIEGDD